MTRREIRAARIRAISEKYNCNPRGKYIVETFSRISNNWVGTRFRFDDIEDAKRYVRDRKDIYGTDQDPARIIHYVYVDEHNANLVVDWKEV